MYNETMRVEPYSLAFFPDCFKTQEMCDKAVEIDPFILWHVPDNLKIQGMCIKAVETGPGLLEYVPDWFVTQQQVKIWRDDDEYCDDEVVRSYKKRKASKSLNKRRTFTNCLASITLPGLVCS